MRQITLNPYLNFNGNTREALEFYHQIFGGELKLQTFSEVPGMEVPKGYEDKIMHGRLDSDAITLMATEGKPEVEVNFGDNVSLSLQGTDTAKLTEIFNALSEGGEVTMPLEKQFWGDIFGALKDKFGVYWMVNISEA
jgi:PhnB protein